MYRFSISMLTCVLVCASIVSCTEDPPLPDNLVSFEAAEQGFDGTETTIKVVLTREEGSDVPLTINLAPVNIAYGDQFTTVPAATANKITLTIPAGSTEASFKVSKPATVFLNGDEKIGFTIDTPAAPILPGENLTLNLSFTAITSDGASITLQGKTGNTGVDIYTNTVYVDLSANQGVAVSRKSWNLGFLSGTDFKVVLNPAYQSAATPTSKTDITTVTTADADAIAASAKTLSFSPGAGDLSVVDKWDGSLGSLAFAPVSATDSENKVYLLSFEGSKDVAKWMKVKVNRNGDGYRVQYALVGETTIRTLDVPKKAAYNYTFVSLENNSIVDAEPAKQNWDIEWAYSTYDAGNNTPYWFQDFILLNNVGGAQAAEIVSASADAAAAAYTAYNEASISTTTFVTNRDIIGPHWRSTQPATGVRKEKFYIIKDPRGNVYKLRFVSMGVPTGDGERGKPVIEYKLVKKAS